jgi:hypothetical protein
MMQDYIKGLKGGFVARSPAVHTTLISSSFHHETPHKQTGNAVFLYCAENI